MNVLILIAVISLFAGLYLIVGIQAVDRYKIFYAGVPVDAVIESCRMAEKRMVITWRYQYGNAACFHNAVAKKSSRRIPGEKGTLLISRKNPEKVYRLTDPDDVCMIRAMGALFITFGIIVLAIWVCGCCAANMQ